MKLIMLVVAVVTLNSCNTMIGLGRDTKQGFNWATNKIQGAGQQNSY
jgi:predicted small secreted protein